MDLREVSGNKNRHPWELSRMSSILRILDRLHISGTVLDIGCGDSYFDAKLVEKYPDIVVYGVDINLTEDIHEGRLHAVTSLSHLPDCKFDCILMMDVLEHIENDVEYLSGILPYLYPNGIVLITVPAFMRLYSLHDRELLHYRRYAHGSLRQVLDKSGLKEISWSYFYFSLVLGRLLTMNQTKNLSGWEHSESALSTRFIRIVLNADFRILLFLSRIGIHLPGLSLLSVCKAASKRDKP